MVQREHQVRAGGKQIDAREHRRCARIIIEEDDEVEKGEQQVGDVEQRFRALSRVRRRLQVGEVVVALASTFQLAATQAI